MVYYEFQKRIYENKIRRSFNVSDLDKEIILMTEEFGELCDAFIQNNDEDVVDAIGDLMVYCLGLSAMFMWNSDEVINTLVEKKNSISEYIPYVGKSLGLLTKTFKKSNQKEVQEIDRVEEFKTYVGNLLGYCENMFVCVEKNAVSVLEQIINQNEKRTHEGQIK